MTLALYKPNSHASLNNPDLPAPLLPHKNLAAEPPDPCTFWSALYCSDQILGQKQPGEERVYPAYTA